MLRQSAGANRPQPPIPKFLLSHGGVYLLSGKTLVAFDLKASLGWTSPRWTSGRASPKRDAPGDLLFCTALPNILPVTSPDSIGGFLQRFHHSRSFRRSPDDLIRAPPAVVSALALIARPPKTTLRHLHPSGSFLKRSAHSRAVVDSSDSLASIDHRRVRRVGPFSDWWPTIRPQSTRKARDDSPEPHRLPTARARWLCQLHRQRLGLRPSVNHRLDARKGGHSTPRACPASGKQAEKKIAAERSTELLIA